MGWSGGSEIMSKVIAALQEHMPDEKARREVYGTLIEAFEDMDWDTQGECEGVDPVFDATLRGMHPHWYEDED